MSVCGGGRWEGKVPGYRDKRWLDPRVRSTEVRGHDFMVTLTVTAVSFQQSRR